MFVYRLCRWCKHLSDTVSVRVPREVKKKLEELNINVSQAVRTYLSELVRREENLSKLEEVNQSIRSRGACLSKGTAERLLREDRDVEH